jgi:hypothetical protein
MNFEQGTNFLKLHFCTNLCENINKKALEFADPVLRDLCYKAFFCIFYTFDEYDWAFVLFKTPTLITRFSGHNGQKRELIPI